MKICSSHSFENVLGLTKLELATCEKSGITDCQQTLIKALGNNGKHDRVCKTLQFCSHH